MSKRQIVLDIEASGLDEASYPIEVGWIGVSSDEMDSFLIKPDPNWTHWDPLTQQMHGLTRRVIERAGLPVEQVVTRLDRALEAAQVYSDAPEWDGFWLDRLYDAAGRSRQWSLIPIGLDPAPVKDCLRLHRALVDAEALSAELNKLNQVT